MKYDEWMLKLCDVVPGTSDPGPSKTVEQLFIRKPSQLTIINYLLSHYRYYHFH